ncbi:biopolymer transporter ExbB [Pseudopelagicola sp. nBUS_19]|uniref:biopolymer transporter ExbB n=1 Tax=unclassified Pseudopelagicola TaxID=2649563 RepID=UPI003EBBB9CF
MDQPDHKVEPQFTQPIRQILLMLIVLGLTGLLAYVAMPRVMPVFIANPYLNGFIGFVFLIGVLACFGQVLSLISSVRWIESFAAHREGRESYQAPSLLAPLAALLRTRDAHSQINTTSTRSILDSVATRIDEGREITRYLVNMLIFLGLLGTFYGLATTVPAVVDTIRSLAPQDGEGGVEVFSRLMTGLEAQLGGMGIAFASSLLGLAGSLIVGLLELFAGHGQNRFYRELEEWLSSITRVGFSSGDSDGVENQFVGLAFDNMVQQLEAMQQSYLQAISDRSDPDDRVTELAEAIHRMADRMETQAPTTQALLRVAEGQERLLVALENKDQDGGIDAESRMRLRSIDVQMLRILEEISAGRHESMAELRTDISGLHRIMRQIARGQVAETSGKPLSRSTKVKQVPPHAEDGQEG